MPDDVQSKATTLNVALYEDEKDAVLRLKKQWGFRTPMDVFRKTIRVHPSVPSEVAEKFHKPRKTNKHG